MGVAPKHNSCLWKARLSCVRASGKKSNQTWHMGLETLSALFLARGWALLDSFVWIQRNQPLKFRCPFVGLVLPWELWKLTRVEAWAGFDGMIVEKIFRPALCEIIKIRVPPTNSRIRRDKALHERHVVVNFNKFVMWGAQRRKTSPPYNNPSTAKQ